MHAVRWRRNHTGRRRKIPVGLRYDFFFKKFKSRKNLFIITRMHSSRMRTVRSSGRMMGGGGVCPRGVCPSGGVPRGCAWGVFPGGCLPGGVCLGAVCLRDVCLRGCLPVGYLPGVCVHLPLVTEFFTHACENILNMFPSGYVSNVTG